MSKWWQETIAYEIYVNSFNDSNADGYGDLKGITQKLDHLAALRVGALWLTPVYPSPMVDNGYDISDYYDINPMYGTMSDMDELIYEASKRNIKIIMDLVTNHTSDQNQWFIKSRASKTGPYADYYIWRDPKEDGSAPNNWRSIFGESAWEYCEERGQYYLHTFAKEQPDLNWENITVREEVYKVANFWLDKGVGGFRLDAIPYIKKPSEFKDGIPDGVDGLSSIHKAIVNTHGILDFLREFKNRTVNGRDVFTVGEANGVPATELNEWVGSHGAFDMIFSFEHTTDDDTWYRINDITLSEVKRAISEAAIKTKDDGWYPIYFENHDKMRCNSHYFPENVDKKAASKVIATLLMTLRGTPFLYQGQELGMTNTEWNLLEANDLKTHLQYQKALDNGISIENAQKLINKYSRDNARTPMQWNATKNSGFTAGKPWLKINPNYTEINAEAEIKDPSSVLNTYIELINLRLGNPVFLSGDFEMLLPDDKDIFAFKRTLDEKAAIVVLNFSDKIQPLSTKLNSDMSNSLLNKKIGFSTHENPNKDSLHPLEARIYFD